MRAMVLRRPRRLGSLGDSDAGPSGPGLVDAGPLEFTELPDPEPAAGEVALVVEACAVCRTDLQLVEGDLAAGTLPVVPGHQVVGTVTAVGAGVSRPAVGERVGVTWLASTCGTCRFCAAGRENLCLDARFTGSHRPGGFAEAMVADARFVHPLPAGLDPVATAPLLCGGVIGLRSLRVAGVQPGERVGLYGFGASASLVVQIAVHWGCEVAVATRSAAEQQRARSLGAVWTGGYDQRPPFPLQRAITFAPSGEVVVRALEALDRGGVVAVNAIHLDRIPEFAYETLWWERELRSVANVTRADAREFLELAAAIPIRTAVQTFPLDAANEALARLAAGRLAGTAVLVPGPR